MIEVELRDARWEMVRPSTYARRCTASTPIAVSGPAAALGTAAIRKLDGGPIGT